MIFTGSGFASAENDIYSGRTSESVGIHIKHALKNKIKNISVPGFVMISPKLSYREEESVVRPNNAL